MTRGNLPPMGIYEMREGEEEHPYCGATHPVGCDYCSGPIVQEWWAPNGSFGHFCARHRHEYAERDGMTILVPSNS
jgi:hypothetical protein